MAGGVLPRVTSGLSGTVPGHVRLVSVVFSRGPVRRASGSGSVCDHVLPVPDPSSRRY